MVTLATAAPPWNWRAAIELDSDKVTLYATRASLLTTWQLAQFIRRLSIP
jgi:hypothetical protein